MPLNAGELNRRVRFERRGVDANGDRRGPWALEFMVWAKVAYLRGGESVLGQRLEGVQPAIITVRASRQAAAIDNSWRAIAAGQLGAPDEVFAVTSPGTPTPERDGFEILAQRGGSDA